MSDVSEAPIAHPTDNIRTVVRALHDARTAAATAAAELAAKRAAFDQEHATLITAASVTKAALEKQDGLLRQLLVAHYQATKKASPEGVGEKKPLPGVGVKISTLYTYDPKLALAWARERKMCLLPEQLDAKGFLDICKSDSNRPDFVMVSESPTAEIAGDLTKTLEAVVTSEAPVAAGDVA